VAEALLTHICLILHVASVVHIDDLVTVVTPPRTYSYRARYPAGSIGSQRGRKN